MMQVIHIVNHDPNTLAHQINLELKRLFGKDRDHIIPSIQYAHAGDLYSALISYYPRTGL